MKSNYASLVSNGVLSLGERQEDKYSGDQVGVWLIVRNFISFYVLCMSWFAKVKVCRL